MKPSRALSALALLAIASPLAAAPQSALEEAHAAFAAGKAEDVLFALLPAGAVQKEDGPEASRLLTGAGRLAAAKGNFPLAQQLWEAGQKKDPANALPVELLARRAVEEKEFDAALGYAKRWSELKPDDPEATTFLARAEALRQSWHPGLDKPVKKPPPGRVQVNDKPIPVARVGTAAQSAAAPGQGPVPQGKIILYGTGWCGVCVKARKWLKAHDLPFDDRDIDHDRASAREVREKLLRKGKAMRGVPVLEVNGTLLQGFSGFAVEQALRGKAPPAREESKDETPPPETSLWDALVE